MAKSSARKRSRDATASGSTSISLSMRERCGHFPRAWLLWCDEAQMKLITGSQFDWAFVYLDVTTVPSRISLLARRKVAGGPHAHDARVWAPWIPSGPEGVEPAHTWTQPSSSSRTNLESGALHARHAPIYDPPKVWNSDTGSTVQPAANISKFWAIIICPEERVARTKVGAKVDILQLDSPFLQPWIGLWLTQLSPTSIRFGSE